jgi:hypothetical protein
MLTKALAVHWVLGSDWRMGHELSVSERREVIKKQAVEPLKESKKTQGVVFDQGVTLNCCSRGGRLAFFEGCG